MSAPVYHITFQGESRGLVKSLPGFRKHHRIPDAATGASTEFVRDVGAEFVAEKTAAFFQQLRLAFGYRRRELLVSEEPGLADLQTPAFTTHLRLDHCGDDPRRYALVVEVDQVTDSSALRTPEFGAVFQGMFDRVICRVGAAISIADVIDRVEEQGDPERVSVEFPPDASRCVVSLAAQRTRLHFEPDAVTLVATPRATIPELIEAGERLPGLLGLGPGVRWL